MIEQLANYHAPIIFLGALLFGETVIIAAAALAAQGHWSVEAVFAWAFLGTVVADVGWFAVAERSLGRLTRMAEGEDRRARTLAWLQRRTGSRPFLVLLFIKFLYGTRILTILYLSMREVRTRDFVGYDAAGTVVWLVVIVSIGWLVGKGVAGAGSTLARLEYTLAAIAVAVLAVKGISAWVSRRVVDE